MTPKINRQLHLVFPLQRDGYEVQVHSTPLDTAVMDTFFLPISKTFAAINAEGLGVVAGPKIAARMLKAISERLGVWTSSEPDTVTVKDGLLAEIRRQTNLLLPGSNGWELRPLEGAAKAGVIDAEEDAEVESFVTFFTVNWLMHRRNVRDQVMKSAAELWGGQLTSSSCTEFRASLPTSTPAESSGATPTS